MKKKKMTQKELHDYRRLMSERIEKATKEDHIIHGGMIYICSDCEAIYYMHLEKGLEDPADDAITGRHKPVPFTFICTDCGGTAWHSMWDLTNNTLGKNHRSYNYFANHCKNFFWNDPNSECGVPIIFEADIRKKDMLEKIQHHRIMSMD